ncbi:putative bifunctional diguanylate cyclase/phosphodiesterase [Undibacterium sp. TJN25]|uniref:putative bifunctional diguanylate cyclase/phosphodiesterase n=1 Tax=Undibacterium sp. TJN25 TaxID=3413056 RepID=UPI003BF34188
MFQKTQIGSALSHKLIEVNLKISAVTLLVATVLLCVFQYAALRSAFVDDALRQAATLANQSSLAVQLPDRKATQEMLNQFGISGSVDAAAILDSQGHSLAEYRAESAEAFSQTLGFTTGRAYRFGLSHLDITQSINAGAGHAQVGLLEVHLGLRQFYLRLMVFLGIVVGAVSAALLIARLLVVDLKKEILEIEAHLQFLAHTDAVTGLPNRHAFSSRLQSAISTVEETGGTADVLLLDLDNFKIVNDTLGHHHGDQLLSLVAQRLSSLLRENDVVCRIGGDEFAIILETRVRKSGGERIAEKVIASFKEPFIVDKQEIYITCSIGISSFPDGGLDRTSLTRNADTAMYRAKAKGKNAFEKFHPEMDTAIKKRANIASNLRKALERGELALYYQPKVSLVDDKVIGFEALLRWDHPEMGAISPIEFIPIAEESGLIIPIGSWVIDTACRQVREWEDAGFDDIKVAVNLSARQTKSIALIDDVLNALRKSGLEPRQLELEITESMLMDNIHDNMDLLENLQAAGIFLSIDDFGTGYSSMAYLKRLPIDQLKIDKAFINDIPGNGDDEAIVSAIISMAHRLGLAVVAEGAETIEQINFLKAAGCDAVQGYYISKPIPAKDVTAFLARRRSDRQCMENSGLEQIVPVPVTLHGLA